MLNAKSLDLLSKVDAQLLAGLKPDRQAMGIPAGLSLAQRKHIHHSLSETGVMIDRVRQWPG